MAEYPINPKQNVFKKYRIVNYINSYVFAPPVDLTTNTEIGGVAGSISTPALLASKLAIDVSRITNFSIVGSGIKCRITGSYAMPDETWASNTSITYFADLDGLVTKCPRFLDCINFIGKIEFINATSIESDGFVTAGTYVKEVILPTLVSITSPNMFDNSNRAKMNRDFYLPNCTNLGGTSGDNSTFNNISSGSIIYTNPILATNNSGSPDGDLAYAISQGAIVRYVTNFTSPNPVTTLSAGTIYNTAVQLNFTPPSSTNAIDYYEVYVGGVFKNRIYWNGGFVNGLTANTNYNIEIYAVDIFYNKSLISNSVNISTTASNAFVTTGDSDANTYISASGLTTDLDKESSARLIVDFKLAGLFSTKIQAMYLFKGNSASMQKYNVKNPVDTDAGFRLTFNGTGTHSSDGYTSNGSTGYANSHFSPSANQNINSNGITVVVGTNNAANSGNVVEVGSYNSASQASYLMVKNNNTNYKRRAALNSETPECSQSGINESRGILTGVRQSSSLTSLFLNGNLIASSVSSGTLPSLSFFIGALNAGSPVTFSNQRIQVVIFHEGLTARESLILNDIINLSETIAGRKTW